MSSILQMNVQAGVLIIAIIIIRAVALDKLPKTVFSALWGIVICRLLVPVFVSSKFSLYGIAGRFFPRTDGNRAPIVEYVIPTSNFAEAIDKAMSSMQQPFFYMTTLTIFWIVGMSVLFIFFAVLSFKNYNELRFSLPIRDNEYFNEWLAKHKCFRPITIMQSDRITTPLAVGIIKPRILLPKTMPMNDEQLLRYVLTHEYYHIRHFDMIWKMLIICTACIHWFNPLVWAMLMIASRDLEILCDEMVIHHFGVESKTDYAYAIIHMAEQKNKFISLYQGFSRNAAEERIASIMKMRKKPMIAILASVVLVVALSIGCTTTTMASDRDSAAVEPATTGEVRSYEQAVKDWEEYGVTYDALTDHIYYKGEKVRFFVDNRSFFPARFSGTVYDMDEGSYYLVTRRDRAGKLVGIDEISEKEAMKIAHWK